MNGEERWEFIYNQINGLNEPDVCGWVRDESTMDGALGPLVEQMYQARDRLCQRAGLDPDSDPDVTQLMDSFEAFSRACGRLMYRYGCEDEKNTRKRQRPAG